MDQQNEGKVMVGGIDVQADGYVLAIYEAERLEAEAKTLYAQAEALRGQRRISVVIYPSRGMPGCFSVLTRLGGRFDSSQLTHSADEACQLASYLIQGFQPPRSLPPFGTPMDRTLPEIFAGSGTCHQTEQISAPKS